MDSFHKHLLEWYDRHARSLPWRIAPQDGKQGVLPDPYHVWLSEVMLQQTTVATVKSYFEKFKSLWPTVENLASASQEDVMKAWAGLGYYSRARNLKACADIIVAEHGGQFPRTQSELQKLPGIGDYTSAAITAIAFGEPSSVVDGNIERVVTRQTANKTPLPKAKDDCKSFMSEVTPTHRPGDFVQAMMDLGATICTPKNPACSLCPVNKSCRAFAAGTMLDFPVKVPKKVKPTRKGSASVIQNPDGAVWLHKREDKGLLASMTTVPTSTWTAAQDGETGIESLPECPSAQWEQRGVIRHTFTHFHLELEVWYTCVSHVNVEGWWCDAAELSDQALPTVMKKVISAVLPDAFKPPQIARNSDT